MLACMFLVTIGCEPDNPGDNETDNPTGLWAGTEEITVTFGTKQAAVSLEGLPVRTYEGTDGVRLSDIITKAKLLEKPEDTFFNFIANDGFDMAKMAIKNEKGLPVWDDIKKGYFYDGGSSSGLTIRWESGTAPGDFGRFYNCKFMDGGIIQILEDDVL